jgi:hypothetical protein
VKGLFFAGAVGRDGGGDGGVSEGWISVGKTLVGVLKRARSSLSVASEAYFACRGARVKNSSGSRKSQKATQQKVVFVDRLGVWLPA